RRVTICTKARMRFIPCADENRALDVFIRAGGFGERRVWPSRAGVCDRYFEADSVCRPQWFARREQIDLPVARQSRTRSENTGQGADQKIEIRRGPNGGTRPV